MIAQNLRDNYTLEYSGNLLSNEETISFRNAVDPSLGFGFPQSLKENS